MIKASNTVREWGLVFIDDDFGWLVGWLVGWLGIWVDCGVGCWLM
jgi:hypothetical protein